MNLYNILRFCNGGRGTRADWDLRYSTRGKDKVRRCSRGTEWNSVITVLRDKTRQETGTRKLEAYLIYKRLLKEKREQKETTKGN
jgi:hypothetical protein